MPTRYLKNSNSHLNSSRGARRSPALFALVVALVIVTHLSPNPFALAAARQQTRRQRTPAAARRTPAKRPAAARPPQTRPAEPTPQEAEVTTAQPEPSPTTAEKVISEEVGEDDVVRVDSNLVTVPATVVDATGRSINDLKLEDFELRVDGQVKPVGEVGRAETPVRLAVLFDNSASLSKAREFEKQAAVRFFRSVMRPADQAAIYSVSTVPVLARPLTSDVRVLVRSIEQFAEPEGATALFDTIAQAAAYLKPFEGRKVILVVSDGSDTVSENSFDQALRQALAADCQIYVVGTGDIENPGVLDTIPKRRLAVFAAQTGGAVSIPQTIEDLDVAFERISNDISQQYVISYYPTDDPPDGRFRTISLRVPARPSLRVRARRGYYARAGDGAARVRPRRARDAGGETARQKKAETQTASFDPLLEAQGNSASSSSYDALTSAVFIVSAKNRRGGGGLYAGQQIPAAQTSPESSDAANATSNPARPRAANSTPERNAQTPDGQTSAVDSSAASRPAASPPSQTAAPTTRPAVAGTTRAGAATEPVSGGMLNGKALSLPKPFYPPAAKSAGARGTVSVEVLIDETGKVVRARAVSGHPLLLQAAVQAARLARFSPTILSGQPVQVSGLLNYNFIIP